MFPLMPETYLWLDHARTTENQHRAGRHRHAKDATTPDVLQQPVEAGPRAAVQIAAATPGMADDLRGFLRRLSATTTYRRFLTPVLSPSGSQLEHLLRTDDDSRALVAQRDGVIVAHAMAVRLADRDAVEIGVVVADRWQHRGIGQQLISELLASCPAVGAGELEFIVAASNDPVARLVRKRWPNAVATLEGTVIHYQVPISQPSAAPALAAVGSQPVLCGAGGAAGR